MSGFKKLDGQKLVHHPVALSSDLADPGVVYAEELGDLPVDPLLLVVEAHHGCDLRLHPVDCLVGLLDGQAETVIAIVAFPDYMLKALDRRRMR